MCLFCLQPSLWFASALWQELAASPDSMDERFSKTQTLKGTQTLWNELKKTKKKTKPLNKNCKMQSDIVVVCRYWLWWVEKKNNNPHLIPLLPDVTLLLMKRRLQSNFLLSGNEWRQQVPTADGATDPSACARHTGVVCACRLSLRVSMAIRKPHLQPGSSILTSLIYSARYDQMHINSMFMSI